MIHNSDFRYDLKVGKVAEDLLANLLENKKVEVKRDMKAILTGNIFVEYESRYKPSGLSIVGGDSNTSKGILLPLTDLIK